MNTCTACGSSVKINQKFCPSCGNSVIITGEKPIRLMKSKNEKMVAGVCGGIAEYYELDPTFVRVMFILFSLFVGSGILLYLLLVIVLPEDERS